MDLIDILLSRKFNKSSGGSGLPEITAADDGKVMAAKNGEWQNVELFDKVGKKIVLMDERSVVPDTENPISDVDISVIPRNINEEDIEFSAIINGTEYILTGNYEDEMLYLTWEKYFPEEDMYEEIQMQLTNDGLYIYYLPSSESGYTMTLIVRTKTSISGKCMPFAIKTGSGLSSIAEGYKTTASGDYSHAEGYETTASNYYSHAEGQATIASGMYSHAEGHETTASGVWSHAESSGTTASGDKSHAEGEGTTASGQASHAECCGTTASGNGSHAEGGGTIASGVSSHAEGGNTIANHRSQHVFGEFNVADPSTAEDYSRGTYVEIVGNGTDFNSKSNARTLDWDGNEVLAGGLTVGAAGITIGSTTITEAQLISLLSLIPSEP